jgi:predicted nucleotidyltransferase
MMKKMLPAALGAIAQALKQELRAEAVILYGSWARGEADEDSDIDLLVIAPCHEDFYQRMARARRLIRPLRKGLAVCPIVLTPEEVRTLTQHGNAFIETILREGIAL